MAGCSQCSRDKSEGLVGCEGCCSKWFHFSCAGLTSSEFGVFSKSKNLFYLCRECKRKCNIQEKTAVSTYSDNLNALNDNLSKITAQVQGNLDTILASFTAKVDDLKSEVLCLIQTEVENIVCSSIEKLITPKIDNLAPKIENISTSVNSCLPSKSYAAAAASATPTFVIKPINKQTVTTTKSDMLRNINPVSSNINLSKLRNARDGGLVVSCNNISDSNKFKELAAQKLSEKYTVQELTPLHPRVRIVGMSEELDAETTLNFIKLQNKDLFVLNSDVKVVSVTRLKKQNSRFQAVLQVDRVTYSNIMKQGKLFVGYDYCNIFDAIEVRRCFKCNGFHHLSNSCTSQNEICPRCAQLHKLSECKSSDLCCINCVNFNKGNPDSTIDTKHAAWDKNCFVYLQNQAKFKNNILDGL